MNIIINNLCKSYGNMTIFSKWSFEFQQGKRYCFMGSSGRGKTTLLRILAGLEKADNGRIQGLKSQKITMVFQENRLCEWENAVKNVSMVATGKSFFQKVSLPDICQQLQQVGIEDLEKPVCQFSGGMKRRVAIVRAIYPESDFVLMDEPFTGLDNKTKQQVIQYVLKEQRERTLIISTHSEEEASLLQGKILKM